MNSEKTYLEFLVKRKIIIFVISSIILFLSIFCISIFIGNNTSPIIYQIFFLSSSVVINLIAAALWYSLIQMNYHLEKKTPIIKAFPFFNDKKSKIYIILASVKSSTGHKLTGLGEARALGMILEALKVVNFPNDKIIIDYESDYKATDLVSIIDNENVIILGGPNFNRFSYYIFDTFHSQLPYVFKEKQISEDKDTVENCEISINNRKRFSGAIIKNTIREEIVTLPLPEGVVDDTLVTKDCGLIIRKKNKAQKYITVLAGGMTAGVWLTAKEVTDYVCIEKWCNQLKTDKDNNEFMIVLENKIHNVLVSKKEKSDILKVTGLLS